jgi:Domain of unknown function (DUF4258)
MATNRLLPSDPLDFIRRCVKERKVLWTYHANMRLRKRFIERESILSSTNSFEVIESYPDDKYLPSYLLLGRTPATTFHVQFAVDLAGDNVRVVTAYQPDPKEWEHDLKTRRKL